MASPQAEDCPAGWPPVLLQSQSGRGAALSPVKPLRSRFGKHLSVTTDDLRKPTLRSIKLFRRLQEGESITDFYDFVEEIKSAGASSKVLIARKKGDSTELVVKIRTKRSNHANEASWREIMTQLHGLKGSRHVLPINEIVEDDRKYYVVMPKCTGGELFEFLVTEAEIPEAECKRIIREIAAAVGHLHEGGLVHRDLKPENIMFHPGEPGQAGEASPRTVKLIDFDTCFAWEPNTPRGKNFVGTPGYIAPEALLGEISPQSDLWSVGVILYILMTGETPWSNIVSLQDGTVGSPAARKMYESMKNEVVDWDAEPWPQFPDAKDLCQRLMAFNVEERLSSVKDVLAHKWLSEPL